VLDFVGDEQSFYFHLKNFIPFFDQYTDTESPTKLAQSQFKPRPWQIF
jgi:hypothetical protein